MIYIYIYIDIFLSLQQDKKYYDQVIISHVRHIALYCLRSNVSRSHNTGYCITLHFSRITRKILGEPVLV